MRRADEEEAPLLTASWTRPDEERQFLGVKLVAVSSGIGARGLSYLVSTYMLFDDLTREQLALMDENLIIGRRTAAT